MGSKLTGHGLPTNACTQDFTFNTFPRIQKRACMKIGNADGPTRPGLLRSEGETYAVSKHILRKLLLFSLHPSDPYLYIFPNPLALMSSPLFTASP